MNIRSRNAKLGARALGAVLVILFMEVGLLAGTIKTKDGKIVSGQIRGMIVQKGEIKLEQSAEGTVHIVSYDMSNGENIDAIDEKGVHRSHLWSFTVSAVGGLPDDIEVFKPGKTGLGADRLSARGLKYYVFLIDFSPRVPSTEKLLGEFRPDNGKDVIIPTLHVTTKEGVVEIPVADIVVFKSDISKVSDEKLVAAAATAPVQSTSWQGRWDNFVVEFNACVVSKTCDPAPRFYGKVVSWQGTVKKVDHVISVDMGPLRLNDREGKASDFVDLLLFPVKGSGDTWQHVALGTVVTFKGTLPAKGSELEAVKLMSGAGKNFAFVQLLDVELLTQAAQPK